MSIIEVTVPDIGDFTDVPVISILVSPGDHVAEEDPLIELESDKATMEVPSPAVGEVKEIKVSEGDTVSEGALILTLEVVDAKAPVDAPSPAGMQEPEAAAPTAATPAPAPAATNLAPVDESGFKTAHASPSVRAFARELGVDLAKLSGSGRKGRILREDVTGFFKKDSRTRRGSRTGIGRHGHPADPGRRFLEVRPRRRCGDEPDQEDLRPRAAPLLAEHPPCHPQRRSGHHRAGSVPQGIGHSGEGAGVSRDPPQLHHQSLCAGAEAALGGQFLDPPRRRQADQERLLQHRLCR